MRTQLGLVGPRGVAVAAAVVAALLVCTLAERVYDVEIVVSAGRPRSIGPMEIGIGAFAAGLCGWAFLAALERVTGYAPIVWTAVTLPVLILSLAAPLSATTVPATITLAGIHLVVGAILVPGLALSPAAAKRSPIRRRFLTAVRW